MQSAPIYRILTAVHPDTVERISRILQGHDLHVVQTIEAATAALGANGIDLIFVGARFDESRMFEFLDYLRTHARHRQIPIAAAVVIPSALSAETIAGLSHTSKLYGASLFVNLNDFPDEADANRRVLDHRSAGRAQRGGRQGGRSARIGSQETGRPAIAPRASPALCSKLAAVRWLLLLGGLLLQTAVAETLSGTVVNVVDGDTLVVQDETKKRHAVRLAEIDAPERRQAFWRESAASLARLCFKKEARVEWTERDAKKRVVGHVTCDGKDAAAEQLRRGMAWGSPKSSRPTSGLPELEAYARLRKIGLWADENAVPPWEFAAKK